MIKKGNFFNFQVLGLAITFFFCSCASSTLIQSNPSGAKVYLNQEMVGTTPYNHEDTRMVGSRTNLELEMEGYSSISTFFSRDEEPEVGAIVGGVFLLFPYLWAMKYKPVRTYQLTPIAEMQKKTSGLIEVKEKTTRSMAERLRELKDLQDEGIISQQEFENEKKKVLADY